MSAPYIGRFAPSPSGPLHAGSVVAALASWLDARAHGGRWLLRFEDTDRPRCVPGAAEHILTQLQQLGLVPDEAPLWQSQRESLYTGALRQLLASEQAFPCGCTRQDLALAWQERGSQRRPGEELPYPGSCRLGLQGRTERAWRFRVHNDAVHWQDRRLGAQSQRVQEAVGDFVLKRADGLWAYQLAVVVDDAAQGITHIVRGEDLADNTPRQLLLQEALKLARPSYLHTPLVLAADGRKLSKQNGAVAVPLDTPAQTLAAAMQALQLPALTAPLVPDALANAVLAWRERWVPASAQRASAAAHNLSSTP